MTKTMNAANKLNDTEPYKLLYRLGAGLSHKDVTCILTGQARADWSPDSRQRQLMLAWADAEQQPALLDQWRATVAAKAAAEHQRALREDPDYAFDIIRSKVRGEHDALTKGVHY